MSVFREYTKEPADPIGLDQVSIWQRLFKKWAKQFFIRTVSGGRLVPDPNGGVHLIIDKPLIPSPTQAAPPPASSDLYYAITTLANLDYFTAVPLTVTFVAGVLNVAFGTAVKVAKYNRQRPSVTSELIDGVTITYSAYTADNTRTASDGTNTEYQVCFPRYTTAATLGLSIAATLTGAPALAFLRSQCVVKCGSIVTGLVDATPSQIIYEELPQRVWARRYTQ